jgi:hypothetical protein
LCALATNDVQAFGWEFAAAGGFLLLPEDFFSGSLKGTAPRGRICCSELSRLSVNPLAEFTSRLAVAPLGVVRAALLAYLETASDRNGGRMRFMYSVVYALAFVVVSSPSRASVDGQDLQTRPDKKDAPLAVTKPAPRPVTITRDGTVSISATRLTLRAVLDDISVQAKLPIVLAESLEEERVSLQLGGASLEEGLKRLLAPYDAFYLFSPSEKEKETLSPSIKGIWIYPKGEGLELQPVPPGLWASSKELEAQLDDPDPGVRSLTFEALIERHGARGLPFVLRGLVDSDDSVRLTTLTAALNVGVEIPTTDLQALVVSDPLQGIRLRALEAIETRPEASAIAESVKNDPDEVIRNTAALLLKHLQDQNTKKPPG